VIPIFPGIESAVQMPANTIKLQPPEAPVNCLVRSKLMEHLRQRERSKLVILQAPAGYGKTTLMSQYYHDLRRRGKTAAWLSLNKSDNDVVTFINLVVESCNYAKSSSLPGDSEAVSSEPQADSASFWRWAINAFDDSNMPDYLFIDEFELINDSTILETISAALIRMPGDRQLILGSRRLPEFSYSKLQLNDEVTILSQEDLRFDESECSRFFLDNKRINISTDEIDRIRANTDGWPAALQISRLLLGKSPDMAGALDRLDQDQLFSDYVVENILAGQDQDIREFLLKTCVLDDLDPAVCQHLSGMANAGDILATLTRTGLFTQRRAERDHYHYHKLFSGTLRQLLVETQPELARLQHRKASEWLLAHQQPRRAAEHALAARDTEAAAAIIEENALAAIYQSELAPVLRWSASIPEQLKASLPNLQSACAWAHVLTRNGEAAEDALGNLRRIVDKGDTSVDILLRSMPIVATTQVLNDQFDGLEESIEAYLLDLPEDAIFERQGVNNVLSYAHLTHNHFESARSIALAVQSTPPTDRSRYTLSYSHIMLAMQQVIQGELRQARLTLDAARELTNAEDFVDTVARTIPIPILAELLYEENHTQEAKSLLEQALPFIRNQVITDHLISAFSNLSRIYSLENQHHLAFKILEDLERQGYSDRLPRLIATARCELARLHQMQGNLERAVDIYQSIEAEGISTRIQGRHFHPADIEADDITRIRLHIGCGELSDARARLKRALDETHSQRVYRRLKLQIMSSLCHQAETEQEAACQDLLQALQSSMDEPFVRIFLDEGEAVIQLLRQLKKHLNTSAPIQDKAAVIGRIDDLLHQAGKAEPATTPAEQELVEPLTKRELEMLQMIADGNSNKEIASDLFVTEGTVKWHLGNIYSKMGVKRRAQAIASGRQLGIIS
jgi:LuxR family maltose regulon positive regulatory protein